MKTGIVHLPDTTFQSPEVRVVEASAGSGKTYALAKRYVQLLLNPALKLEHIPIRNILAITFTNKAAFEMKSRILEVLKQLALGTLLPKQKEDILAGLGIDDEFAAQKAYSVMESIIRNYNFFQVQTIDKFINALLAGCAFKIGLTANFRIKTNSPDYLERSLDVLIDSIPQNPQLAKIFQTFIHHYLYLENRTGWFPKEDMLAINQNLFAQYNCYGLPFKENHIVPEDLIKRKRQILDDMQNLKLILPETTDKRFLTSLEKFLANRKGFDIDSVPDFFARENVPVRKGTDIPKNLDALWTKIGKSLCELCEQEAHSLFNPYIQTFHQVMQQFYQLTAKDDVLFLEELNKRAGLLFDEDRVTVEELYYRLATRFHHYCVDEFQDTSRLQWHNLEKMAEEALSTGGTLFYVGDRKQAIYSFRGGDVSLFEEVKQEFGPFNVRTEILTNNWRSQKAIVEFNNHIFSLENLRRFLDKKEEYEKEKNSHKVGFSDEDWQNVASVYQNAQQTFQPENGQGFVQFQLIDADGKEERNEMIRKKIAELIRQLHSRFSYRDITILTRDNSEIEQITNWLLEDGILVNSERTSNVKENYLIQELLAFLRFLDSPIDNLSFTQFILGDLFSKTSGTPSRELHHFVFSLRHRLKAEKDFYLYTAFREHFFDIWEQFIEEFFKNVGLYPLYELVVSIYYRMDCLKHFPQAQGFLMHFLELIKKNEEDHADIEAFLNYFEELQGEDLFVQITDSDAVKILTVHKAKGLEFPVVILPFLGMEVQVGSSRDNVQSYILKKEENTVELLRFKTKYTKYSDEIYQVYAEEYKKSFLSELNNMYVALTRARYEMYGFIPKKVGLANNLTRFLIPEEFHAMGNQVQYAIALKKEHPIIKLPCSCYHDWIAYLKDEFLDLADIKYRRERRQGEVVHFLLSFVQNLKEQKIGDVLKTALSEAQLKFPLVEDWSEFQTSMERILRAKTFKQFFYLDKVQVFTEREIINAYGDTKRIDRLIISDKEILIVDYKATQDPLGRYADQLRGYLELISGIYPQHQVKGFLLYLDCLEFEEVV